jgi:PleD family two-component response regulator|nr:diguanylate cyclase [Clostridium paraputrificum]
MYNKNNRFKFLNSIKNKKSKYFIVCLDIIKFREINDKYGILEGDKLLKEVIEFIEYLDVNKSYKIESCIYEKDIILININSRDENEVIKTMK